MKYFVTIIILTLALTVDLRAEETYEVKDIPLPKEAQSSEIDGLCVMPGGNVVVTLPSGQVFLYDPDKKTWSLFAEGLHNPLGVVALSDSSIVVCQRPELTRITDTDGDGKADLYEALSDKFGVSGNYHEFNFGPTLGPAGSLYFGLGTASSGNGIRRVVRGPFDPRGRPGRMYSCVPYRGCVMQYTPSGKTLPFAYGIRTPNGLGFDLKGNLYVSDNQGDWVGSSKLFHVQKNNFYGHVASLTWKKNIKEAPLKISPKKLDAMRTRACIVFPHGSMSRSPTQPLCDTTKGKFGPFAGQMFVGDMNHVKGKQMGNGRLMRVMLEKVDGVVQGACTPFIDARGLKPGVNRLAFDQKGRLWIGCTRHTWVGGKGLQMITWNGKMPMEVKSMKITQKGFKLTFTKAVDKSIASRKETYAFKRNWYEYHQKYGSKTFENADVGISKIKVSSDGKTVDIELKELKCYFVHELRIKGLKAKDGTDLQNTFLAYTVNRLVRNTPPEPEQFQGGKR